MHSQIICIKGTGLTSLCYAPKPQSSEKFQHLGYPKSLHQPNPTIWMSRQIRVLLTSYSRQLIWIISPERGIKDSCRGVTYGGVGRPAVFGGCCCLRWSQNNSLGGWGTGATLEALSFISSNKLASLLPTNYLINSIIVTECTWLITLFTSTLMVADYLLQDLRRIRNDS